MSSQEIIALLRMRSSELKARANQTMSSLHGVIEADETKDQRKLRSSAQADWSAAEEIAALAEQIENRLSAGAAAQR